MSSNREVKQREAVTEGKSRKMEGGELTAPQAKPLPYQLPQPLSCHLWTCILYTVICCMHHVVSHHWAIFNVVPQNTVSCGFGLALLIILGIALPGSLSGTSRLNKVPSLVIFGFPVDSLLYHFIHYKN